MQPIVLTYKLLEPVVLAGSTISELQFRKPTSKQCRQIPLKEELLTIGVFLDVAAKLTDQPPTVLDQLGMEDMQEVVKITADFIGSSQPTGEPPSAS